MLALNSLTIQLYKPQSVLFAAVCALPVLMLRCPLSVHFMQGVTQLFIFVSFFFLEESCIKVLVYIHSTARLL